MIYLLAYIVYTAIGIWWFLNRMGDKHGSDKRWFIRPLDWMLIGPLMPYAYLVGYLSSRARRA